MKKTLLTLFACLIMLIFSSCECNHPIENLILHDAKVPTCTEKGWDSFVSCSKCGMYKKDRKAALGHDMMFFEAKEPTCTEAGWQAHERCSRCDYKTCEEIPAIGHDYKDGVCTHCNDTFGSEGLKFKSNGNGTCYVSGIGTCADLEVIIPIFSPNGDIVTSIGESAFEDCTNLESIQIPDSVTSIGESAFEDCTSLESIQIPDSVTSIGYNAFSGCTNLVRNENGVYYIGKLVIDCDALATSVSLKNDTECIGDSAFAFCKRLTSIEIPDSVTRICEEAFYACSSLESIIIPEGITSVGYGAFYGCSSLKTVYFTGTEEEWSVINGISNNYYLETVTIIYNYVPEE